MNFEKAIQLNSPRPCTTMITSDKPTLPKTLTLIQLQSEPLKYNHPGPKLPASTLDKGKNLLNVPPNQKQNLDHEPMIPTSELVAMLFPQQGKELMVFKSRGIETKCKTKKYLIQVPPNGWEAETTVNTLIAETGCEWNTELIRDKFCADDVELILSIPLGRGVEDKMVWHRSRKGDFSVHSAYNLHREIMVRGHGSYRDWMRDIMSKLQGEQIQWFVVVCWMLWSSRNKTLMENEKDEPHRVLLKGQSFLQAFRDSIGRSRAEQQQEQMVHWRPPPAEVVKLNFDGALFANPKCRGAGVVARNSAGECLGWKASLFQGVADAEHAEALGARTTMELAVTKGWRRISIEGDCLNIIRRLNSSAADNSMLGPIIHHTRELGRFCTEVEFSFIRKDGNRPGHLLARQAGNASRCWVELPNDVRAALLADSCQPE
ncbi:hypothetical protein Salat_0677100 [Sesamum alatum]|uniref:RNase H type-1 domain-containing protein n=1 Tax=Sesamum alatum TaxID=300844 RepID=A0AAE2CUP0_9LAMI|nr:hypothetical protein Salat_0677100 [Sesamum alatum]